MDLKLKNKVVFITGASSGIGKACVELLAQEGAFVIVGYRSNQTAAENVIAEVHKLGGAGFAIQFDLCDIGSVTRAVTEIISKVGSVYSLILNAGENTLTPFDKIDADEWDQIFSTNLKGPYFLLQKMIPHFEDAGSVVLVSSIAGQAGAPGHAHYAAAKAGLINLGKSAAKFFASKVRVNCVSPGVTMTPMGADAMKGASPEYAQKMLLSRRIANPEEIANVIVFLASSAASFIYGATIDVNGGRELR